MAKSLELKANVNAESLSSEQLITDHIDIWTSAIEQKSSAGRGTSSKFSLYGIKKLRELILELAVRGKLVPQDPNDEPASVLLERIAAEKAQLVKEGKLKKQKPLPEIAEEEKPFELPQGWDFSRLGFIGEIFNGNSINAKLKETKYTGLKNGLPFIATKDVNYGFNDLDYENGVLIPFDEPKFKVAKKESVLICAEGGSAGKKCGLATQDVCFGNKLFALYAYDEIDPKFILSNYLTPAFYAQFSKAMTGIIGGISLAKFSELLIPLPPLEEQHRIVAKVDELMSLCDALETQTEASISAHQTLVETLLNALLLPNTAQQATTNASNTLADSLEPAFDNSDASSPEPSLAKSFEKAWLRIAEHFDTLFTTSASIDILKQTILQFAVLGKLVPQELSDEPSSELVKKIASEKEMLIANGTLKNRQVVFKEFNSKSNQQIPSTWTEPRIGDIAFVVTDGTHKTPTYTDSGIRFVSAKDISTGKLSFSDCKFISHDEHIQLITRCKPELGDLLVSKSGSIGTVVIVDDNDDFSLFESLALIKFSQTLLIPGYFRLALQNACHQMTDEHIRGVAVKHLHLNVIRGMRVPLPPLNEQYRIVAKVDELMALCDQLKARLTDAKTTQLHLTDAILEQVTGKVTDNKKGIREKVPMEIRTNLTTTSKFNGQPDAILAKIISTLDDTDAKSVWSKSGLELPQFYKQLKTEIDLGFIDLPSKAEFL
ncbi:restriction endonuclease subunit S [Shewanella sp. CAL98-MNA-CIBAN-0140]|uniref:restriction endonuclease subunit S n=1 Tax=Shewanella sp. CAL98-MNA-CIBAN-0140 TaxID=3140462 RepID=UPI0033277F66